MIHGLRRSLTSALALSLAASLITGLSAEESPGSGEPLPECRTADELVLRVDAARQSQDARLALLLAQHGLLRFPADERFRQQELALLVAAERWEEARGAVTAQLAHGTESARAWQILAAIDDRRGAARESLAATEAALLTEPGNADLRRRLAQAQLADGLAPAARRTLEPLLAAAPNDADRELAARAAQDAGDAADARRQIAAIPAERRSRQAHLLDACCAVELGIPGDAATALEAAIAAGESNPAILTWAGRFAADRGDAATAEAHWRQALLPGPGPASLHLAQQLIGQQRLDAAREILDAYRDRFPDDRAAAILAAGLR